MWKICIDDDEMFSNAEYIFPTQQFDVSKIIKRFSKNDSVKRIIIFGSSVPTMPRSSRRRRRCSCPH